jgi:hypothetical protein
MSKINLKSVNQTLSNKELKDVLGGGWASAHRPIGGIIVGVGDDDCDNTSCGNVAKECMRSDGTTGRCYTKASVGGRLCGCN